MEKAVHSRPVSEEDEALSCSKKLKLEASTSSEDTEKYTLFADSEYKMPLYLSEFALSEFNSDKETMYEKVKFVKAMKSFNVKKGTTYLITFEASLPDNMSNNAQTFQAKIYMSALDPSTKISIKFVRINASDEFVLLGEDSESSKKDYEEEFSDESDEKDNKEKPFELDNKDPKAKLSEFAEKETEEKFSKSDKKITDFNRKGSVEEKLPESDEKDTEKKLFQFAEKETEEKFFKSDEKITGKKLSDFNRKDSVEEQLAKFDGKETEEKFSDEKLTEKNVYDFNGKDSVEEKLAESDEKDIEKNLFGYTEKEIEEKFSKSDEKITEKRLSDLNGKDSVEEKLTESDVKDTEKRLSEFDGKDSAEEPAKIDIKKSAEENLAVRRTSKRRGSMYKRKGPEYSKEIKQYSMDLQKSDGFEVGIYPHITFSCCMVRCYYDPPNRNLPAPYLNQLVCLSQLAICVYNTKEGTYYDNVEVLKAMAYGCGGRTYNITFEASLSDGNSVTFQTKISTSLPFPYHKIEIIFVRIKPSIIPHDLMD